MTAGRATSVSCVLQDGATGTGNGATMGVAGLTEVALEVVIATTATVQFESSLDGTAWYSLGVTPSTGGSKVTSATASGLFFADCAGLALLRARISAWTAGEVDVRALGIARP